MDFETAGVGSRILAAVIDVSIQGALLLLALMAIFAILDITGGVTGDWLGAAFVYLTMFLVVFGYPVAFETLLRGRSPGKMALGLRVVTVEGSPVRFRHAAVRALLGVVEFLLTSGAVAVIAILLTRRNQRLGDLVAGTLVLRERTGAKAPTAVSFPVPYGYESYAATLDVSGVTEADYGAVRAFLLRATSLTPHVRYDLAVQLAAPLAARINHVPPATVPPELFLACVAARYQQRGGGRPGPTPYGPQAAYAQPAYGPPPDRAPAPVEPAPPAAGGFAPPA